MPNNTIEFHCADQTRLAEFLTGKEVILSPVFSSGENNRLAKRFAGKAEMEGFQGKTGETLSVSSKGGTTIFFGLGAAEKFNVATWREGLQGAVSNVRSLNVKRALLVLPEGICDVGLDFVGVGKLTGEVVTTGLYRRNHYKTAAGGFEEKPHIQEVVVLGHLKKLRADGHADHEPYRQLGHGFVLGGIIGRAVNSARDTANKPANLCTPTDMAQWAIEIGQRHASLNVRVLDRTMCEARGMKSFLAVAQGSDQEPQFIIMEYTPRQPCFQPNGQVLALIGKSVTFDSGGLDLKPASSMRDMKYDMCGGADVIAAMEAIASLGLPIRVTGYCAATENMTGGSAMRPGDVYIGLDGKSYEIDNTDAEGRLTLVDAISYARIHGGATHIVDYATLTGAILSVLGDQAAGVFSNSQNWADQYIEAAQAAGEKVWQLPTWDVYKKQNKSDIADLKNTGGSGAGSITAALFVLSAAHDIPTVHVDIAGVGFRSHEVGGDPKGGTGWGVRTLVELATRLASTKV